MCSYNSATEKWYELPKHPYCKASLVVIDGKLTAIGGELKQSTFMNWCDTVATATTVVTNELYCLKEIWKVDFPPMPTKRYGTTAVTTGEHLIVAGGVTQIQCQSSKVEVMDTETKVWSTVCRLPHPYSWGSATICGDQLYILGGCDDKGMTKSVLTCSLTELLQSSSVWHRVAELLQSLSSSSAWHKLAVAPAYHSTCAAVNGELLAVGGCEEGSIPTGEIHKYNKTTKSWEPTGNMPSAKSRCLVAILPMNEMMIAGCETDKVEFANISFYWCSA